ncbi:uroporphyrinogen decarboxylase [Oceanibacterium hippocampi]|uniref:Uroporphyrinogen decarboxylase n=1 Tax=Oceanibacterium hippocampi TaxID=745714 RepID=A0A1Y5RNR7_9PROT|nr:uroporphyrinogen decarboxylase [Oceanibacterium hippocampi]SLN20776.1 Uroporphyrinogen decarboxylase [Oceanibacterium hippocampi]
MPNAEQVKSTAERVAKPLLRVLAGDQRTPPPIWLMRQAGRYLPEYRAVRADAGGFLDLCYDSERSAEVTLQPIRRYGFDAAIVFADILLIPHALGQDVAFKQGEGPCLEPIRKAGDLAVLRPEGMLEKLEPVMGTLRILARELPSECALIGFAGAPWTVATYMVEGGSSKDYLTVKRWAFGEEPGFAALIDRLVEATADYLVAQVRAGAEVVQIFDTWAGVLPEAAFRRWCVAPVKAIVERFRAQCPTVPVIAFPRGAGPLLLGYAAETGVDGVSLDSAMPLAWARENLNDARVLQGNLDPALLVAGGQPMREGIATILEAMKGRSHIFNLGHGIVPPTPPEHVGELVATVRELAGRNG